MQNRQKWHCTCVVENVADFNAQFLWMIWMYHRESGNVSFLLYSYGLS